MSSVCAPDRNCGRLAVHVYIAWKHALMSSRCKIRPCIFLVSQIHLKTLQNCGPCCTFPRISQCHRHLKVQFNILVGLQRDDHQSTVALVLWINVYTSHAAISRANTASDVLPDQLFGWSRPPFLNRNWFPGESIRVLLMFSIAVASLCDDTVSHVRLVDESPSFVAVELPTLPALQPRGHFVNSLWRTMFVKRSVNTDMDKVTHGPLPCWTKLWHLFAWANERGRATQHSTPQDADGTQRKVGHHNVTRSGVKKLQDTSAVPVSCTTTQHSPSGTCLTVLETLRRLLFPPFTESIPQRVCIPLNFSSVPFSAMVSSSSRRDSQAHHFLGDELLRLGRSLFLYPQVLHVHVFRFAQAPAGWPGSLLLTHPNGD